MVGSAITPTTPRSSNSTSAKFRRRPPCSWSDYRNSSKSGSVWESSVGMTRDSRWHSACRLRMLSRTSIDARLLCTNREVQSDLNGRGVRWHNDWRVLSLWAVQRGFFFEQHGTLSKDDTYQFLNGRRT